MKRLIKGNDMNVVHEMKDCVERQTCAIYKNLSFPCTCVVMSLINTTLSTILCISNALYQQHFVSTTLCQQHFVSTTLCQQHFCQQHFVSATLFINTLYQQCFVSTTLCINNSVSTILCINDTLYQQHFVNNTFVNNTLYQQHSLSTLCISNALYQQHSVSTTLCINDTLYQHFVNNNDTTKVNVLENDVCKIWCSPDERDDRLPRPEFNPQRFPRDPGQPQVQFHPPVGHLGAQRSLRR